MIVRTGYSFKTAVGTVEEVLTCVKDAGQRLAILADRDSTFAFNKWTKGAKKAGLRPVYGVELGVVPQYGLKKPPVDYWRFVAKGSLRPLHDLIAKAHSKPGGYLLYNDALAAYGVIKVTGERTLLGQFPSGGLPSDVYVGCYPSSPRGLIRDAVSRGIPLLASSDNYYPREDDKEFYRVALGRRSSTQTYPMHIYEYRPDDFAGPVLTTSQVFDACHTDLVQAVSLTPKAPKGLRQLCVEGAERIGIDMAQEPYRSRLDRELEVIFKKGFEDYFQIVADMVSWAKQYMVVGPARGSSCGSLVCYLTGITSVDPIPYGLLFERFIDLNRADLPDIDIDFSDTRRGMVFEYAESKYGKERVARLGTVGMFQPRSALTQAASSLRIPKWDVEKVYDSLIDRSPGDERSDKCLEDTLNFIQAGQDLVKKYPEIAIAARMEGHPHNAGQHAAGIVITQEPVVNYVAVGDATMCDKRDAEEMGLLKIDALGLTQLSIFERALDLVQKPLGFLNQIPLDDKKAFDVLNSGRFSGLFQFSGQALRSLTKQIKVTEFNDLVSLTALARPGPMANAQKWIDRKNGKEDVTYAHSSLEPFLKETLGIIIFQEQVMQIAREIGRMSWEDVTALRRAMGKSMGKEAMARFESQWRQGAAQSGLPPATIATVWDDLCAHGEYSFNKSHSVAYSYISMWTMWFKAHHPLEFAAATLDAENLPEKQIPILRELRNEGIDYKAVDVDLSEDRWMPAVKDGKRILVGPLTAIKGIGPATLREVLDSRKTGSPVRDSTAKKLDGARTSIDSLTPVADAIKRLHPDLVASGIVSPSTPVSEVQCGVDGQVMILALAKKITIKDENDAASVARRGYQIKGNQTRGVNMFFADDTDEVFCKINRFMFDSLGQDVLRQAQSGKSLYAIKGLVPKGFRMIDVKGMKYLGELE